MIPLFLIFLSENPLVAEIEKISLSWNDFYCVGTCPNDMRKNLLDINEIKDLEMSPGYATMKWNASTHFSYEPFRYASAAVGIHISMMRVKVIGHIQQKGVEFFLISDGDQTPFFLIGPLKIEQGGYSPSNIQTHPLTQNLIAKLTDAEKRNLKVVIEGPLLVPSFYTRALIVEYLHVKNL